MLFESEGILAVIFSYGQMLSIFLVLFCVEAIITAKSESKWPGLVFLGLVFLLAVFIGWIFHEFMYFVYMLVPVALCAGGYCIARYVRKRNLEKGATYNENGVLEDDSML